MRMFLKSLSILLLVSLLIGGLVGCDMLGGTTEDTGSDDSETATVSLTSYSAVGYADLGTVANPTQDTVTAITTWNPEVTDAMISALGGMQIIMHGLGVLEDDPDVSFVPRSITGTVALSVEDEHFSIEEDLGSTTETWLDLNIEHLDLVLSGGIHSLTALIDSMINDPDDPTAMFPANGQVGLSFKADIAGKVNTGSEGYTDLLTSQSGYLSIALTDLDADVQGNPSGTLNAKLKYSVAMNYLVQVNEESSSVTYMIPVLCTISMKETNNANLTTLGAAINALDEESDTYVSDLWNAIENSLWGASDTPCISISATYKDADGAIQNLQHVTDSDALTLIIQMLKS